MLALQVVPSCSLKHSEVKNALKAFYKVHPQLLPMQHTAEATDTLCDQISYSLRILLRDYRKCVRKPHCWNTVVKHLRDEKPDVVHAVGKILGKIELPPEEDDEMGPQSQQSSRQSQQQISPQSQQTSPQSQQQLNPPSSHSTAIVPALETIGGGEDLMKLHTGPPAEIFQVQHPSTQHVLVPWVNWIKFKSSLGPVWV